MGALRFARGDRRDEVISGVFSWPPATPRELREQTYLLILLLLPCLMEKRLKSPETQDSLRRNSGSSHTENDIIYSFLGPCLIFLL